MAYQTEEKFKNLPTKKLYYFLKNKLEKKQLKTNEIGKVFGYDHNASSFMSNLKGGHMGITVDHILHAEKNLKLNPSLLFIEEEEYENNNVLNNHGDINFIPGNYDTSTSLVVPYGKIIGRIIKKHGTSIAEYGPSRLGISRQAFHEIINGGTAASLEVAVKVADDHGESLDIFL